MFIRNPETKQWEEVFLPPTGDTFPVGSVSAYAGENIPTNWLRCDGQEVSRTEYAELFNAIGTTYGTGDGSTTFNLPDLNTENRTIVGSNGDGEFSLGNINDNCVIDSLDKKINDIYDKTKIPRNNCKKCKFVSLCEGTFCSNCQLLDKPEVKYFEYDCKIIRSHFQEALLEIGNKKYE